MLQRCWVACLKALTLAQVLVQAKDLHPSQQLTHAEAWGAPEGTKRHPPCLRKRLSLRRKQHLRRPAGSCLLQPQGHELQPGGGLTRMWRMQRHCEAAGYLPW